MGKNVKGKIYGKYLNQAKYVIKGRKLKSPIAKLHKREITTGNYYRSVSEINKVKISISNDDKKITKVEPIETNIQSKASDGFEFIEESVNVKNEKVSESKILESKISESMKVEPRISESKDLETRIQEYRVSESIKPEPRMRESRISDSIMSDSKRRKNSYKEDNKEKNTKEEKIKDLDKKISELDEVLEEKMPKKKYNDTRSFIIAAAFLAVIIVVGIVKLGSQVFDAINDSTDNINKNVSASDKGLFDIFDTNASEANNQNVQSNQLDNASEVLVDEEALQEKVENGEITKEQAEQIKEQVKNGNTSDLTIKNGDKLIDLGGIIKTRDPKEAEDALNNDNNTATANPTETPTQPGDSNNAPTQPNDGNDGNDNGNMPAAPTSKPNKYNIPIDNPGGNNIELYRISGSFVYESDIYGKTQFTNYQKSGNQILLPEESAEGMWFVASTSPSEIISRCAIINGTERKVYAVVLKKKDNDNYVGEDTVYAIAGTKITLSNDYYDNAEGKGDEKKEFVVNGNMILYKK